MIGWANASSSCTRRQWSKRTCRPTAPAFRVPFPSHFLPRMPLPVLAHDYQCSSGREISGAAYGPLFPDISLP